MGKTSILEAITMASVLKSFRNARERDMIKWDNEFFSISVSYSTSAGEQKLHLGYGRHPQAESNAMLRSMSVNKQKVERIAEFIGRLPTVVFSPDDIDIIDTDPAERRRFIDMILSSLNSSYLEALQLYRRALRLRTEFFKKVMRKEMKFDNNYLTSIDKELAKSGHFIQQKRAEFLSKFQDPFGRYVGLISGQKDQGNIIYEPSVKEAPTVEQYLNALKNARPKDVKMRQTTQGIHRDKIVFSSNKKEGLDLQQIASQGQKRTVALALKMAQFDYTKSLTSATPILLIDDVLNELDIERRKSFILFLNEIGQALITTTDLAGIENYVKENEANFTVEAFEVQNSDDGLTLQKLTL